MGDISGVSQKGGRCMAINADSRFGPPAEKISRAVDMVLMSRIRVINMPFFMPGSVMSRVIVEI